jgi:hypothetical protein
VLFEAGMAIALHPTRTVLVQVGEIRPISDIAGRHLVRLTNAADSRQNLANRLATAGCPVDLSGTQWHTVGDFDRTGPIPISGGDDQREARELTEQQTLVLRFLAVVEARHPNPRLQDRYVAEQLGISRPLAKHLLDELTSLGLVSRDLNWALDSVHYTLSGQGRALLANLGLL